MLKKISKLETTYNGELFIDDDTKKKIKEVWDDFIKDKDPNDFWDGDIYSATEINTEVPSIKVSKTKFSTLIYAKKDDNFCLSPLSSAGYVITSDNFMFVILDKTDKLNFIGGLAADEDIINDKFDYNACLFREFKEELGIDLNDESFEVNLKYFKYPGVNERIGTGTIFEIRTKYTSNELQELFNNNNHDDEVKELKFYNKDNYKEIYNCKAKGNWFYEVFEEFYK